MEIDFVRLWHWLERFNITPAGFYLKEKENEDYKPRFEKQFHASGHASREDISWVIDQIDPDHVTSIHTEGRGWFAKNFENVVLADEGATLRF